MFFGILNQSHVANSHSSFGQLFWIQENAFGTRKCVLWHPKYTWKGPLFGGMGSEKSGNFFFETNDNVNQFPVSRTPSWTHNLPRPHSLIFLFTTHTHTFVKESCVYSVCSVTHEQWHNSRSFLIFYMSAGRIAKEIMLFIGEPKTAAQIIHSANTDRLRLKVWHAGRM